MILQDYTSDDNLLCYLLNVLGDSNEFVTPNNENVRMEYPEDVLERLKADYDKLYMIAFRADFNLEEYKIFTDCYSDYFYAELFYKNSYSESKIEDIVCRFSAICYNKLMPVDIYRFLTDKELACYVMNKALGMQYLLEPADCSLRLAPSHIRIKDDVIEYKKEYHKCLKVCRDLGIDFDNWLLSNSVNKMYRFASLMIKYNGDVASKIRKEVEDIDTSPLKEINEGYLKLAKINEQIYGDKIKTKDQMLSTLSELTTTYNSIIFNIKKLYESEEKDYDIGILKSRVM